MTRSRNNKLAKRESAVPAIVARDRVVMRLQEAEHALTSAVRVDQAKLLMDVAAAQLVFAKRQKLGDDVIGYAHEIKTRALIKLGELLKHADKATGTRRQLVGRGRIGGTRQAPPIATYKSLGIDKKTASVAQRLATLPSPKRAAVAARELTVSDAMRQLRPARRADKLARAVWPTGKYGVVLADPPWRPDAGLLDPTRQIENQYPTATLDELSAMRAQVDALALDDCVLLLWTTTQKLAEAATLIDRWGFVVKSGAVWIKPSVGMGYWFRGRHELLILATRGNPMTPLESDRPDSVITAPRSGHSEKPPEVYAIVERMFPQVPKVELFARAVRAGWAHATNEESLRRA